MLGQPILRALRAPGSPLYASLPARANALTISAAPLTRTFPTPRLPRSSPRWVSDFPSRRVPSRIRQPAHRPSTPLFTQNFPSNRRPFFSGPRFQYQKNDQYNRFGGSGRQQTVMFRLMQDAKPHHFVIIGVVLSGLYLYNTEVVEMTGRRRFNCVSHQRELKMGDQSYHEVLNAERGKVLSENHPLTRMVNRVLQRLIPLAPLEGADWKVHVIKDDDMVNAFVLPGGKVFVYTGILPICEDEDGLAAVLGHEIAHVVAHHPAERMSNSFLTIGTAFLVSFLFDVSGQLPSMLLNLMYSLPNSRTQEAEADNMGLMMMSKACFNPQAAVTLWSRMQKMEKGSPPQFMSTHPSSYNRMEAIQGWLLKAEAIYDDSGCSAIGRFMPGFRDAYGQESRR